eukprot:Gb_40016 [translate_table: standard]
MAEEQKQLNSSNGVQLLIPWTVIEIYLHITAACTEPSMWNFSPTSAVMECSHDMLGIRGVLDFVMSHLNPQGKSKIPLGHGDPSQFDCFRTSGDVEDALMEVIKSRKYNGYSPAVGLPQSRK